jgi:hypothetical protein
MGLSIALLTLQLGIALLHQSIKRPTRLSTIEPTASVEFIRELELLEGLLPLDGNQNVDFGQNVFEALSRHARTEQLPCRITRDDGDRHIGCGHPSGGGIISERKADLAAPERRGE